MMRSRQDNDVTDCTSAIYVEDDSELSWRIEPGPVFDES